MEFDYKCPKCKSLLNIGNKIVFSVKVKSENKGLIMFDKELGNYQVKKHDLIQYKKGEMVGFYCPICHENLAANDVNANLARVLMVDDDGDEHIVLFSKIAGEQATYKLSGSELKAFGEDKHKYMNHFGQ